MKKETWDKIVNYVKDRLTREDPFTLDIETFEKDYELTGDYQHEMLMRLDRSHKEGEREDKPPFKFHTEPKGREGRSFRAIIFTTPK
jgi:hypothetical protein